MKFPYWYHQISMESNSDEGWLAAARFVAHGPHGMIASEQRIFRGCSLRYGQHQETTRRYGWTREFVSKTTSSNKCRRLDHLMTAKRPGRLKTWSCRQKTTKSASPSLLFFHPCISPQRERAEILKSKQGVLFRPQHTRF